MSGSTQIRYLKCLWEVNSSENLRTIANAVSLEAIGLIEILVTNGSANNALVGLYLLGSISRGSVLQLEQLIEGILGVANIITEQEIGETNLAIVGSTLLSVLDRLAFEFFPETGNISVGNIIFQARLLSAEGENQVTTINSEDFVDGKSRDMSIEIPQELVQTFSSNGSAVRAVSFLYYNVENLFPSGRPGENNTELGSGIVSTSLQCGTGSCPTVNLQLNTNVTITIEHSENVKEQLGRNEGSSTECVFWEFLNDLEGSVLSVGQWSDRGCMKNENLSNASTTVCECNHLTHFAILLSASPLNVSNTVILSLRIIGYIGVSVSLVAMALTIITFTILKSLRNMRNFIHINLCISLGITQLIFIAGVDQASSANGVPIHCQVIAVLLHYFFLVSFMWMLMEGVVLYVILIRVFVSNTKRYMLAFTIASYGVPLLYLSLLGLPLGFALPTQPNYGYHTACFLNPETHFIWAFILPVLVIILTNIGFFIMAAIVMWQHKKKQKGSMNAKDVRNWLKALVSLVVIMGLTSIMGVLIVEVEELLTLAYIYTILVAFQGLWIFLIFVAFPKQVRDEYIKAWKSMAKTSSLFSKFMISEKGTLSTGMKSGQADTSKRSPKNTSSLLKEEKEGKEMKNPVWCSVEILENYMVASNSV